MKIKGTIEVCAHYVEWWFEIWETPQTDELRKQVEHEAESRAKEMINEGYVQGELCSVIDDEDFIEARGWWKIQR